MLYYKSDRASRRAKGIVMDRTSEKVIAALKALETALVAIDELVEDIDPRDSEADEITTLLSDSAMFIAESIRQLEP